MLLLMAGFAGAGKTTLAKWVSEKLQELGIFDWDMLNKDHLKLERLEAGEGVEQAGREAFDELVAQIKRHVLIQKTSVIIDTSNENPFVFNNVTDILKQQEFYHIQPSLMVILCVANKETRTRRLKKRGSEFEPFVKDLPEILDDAELTRCFSHLLKNVPIKEQLFQPSDRVSVQEIENGLVINTMSPVEEYGEIVLAKIKAFLQREPPCAPS